MLGLAILLQRQFTMHQCHYDGGDPVLLGTSHVAAALLQASLVQSVGATEPQLAKVLHNRCCLCIIAAALAMEGLACSRGKPI